MGRLPVPLMPDQGDHPPYATGAETTQDDPARDELADGVGGSVSGIDRGPEDAVAEAVARVGLGAALESLLLISDEPLGATVMAEAVRRPLADVEESLTRLSEEYARRGCGFELRRTGVGWRFTTVAGCAPVIEAYIREGQRSRLSQAALETLAVVAYRQPVTRSRVAAVRGVNVDGVVRTLVARGLIEDVGTEAETGATLYRTTSFFLERLGLASLSDLPDLANHLPDIHLAEREDVTSS